MADIWTEYQLKSIIAQVLVGEGVDVKDVGSVDDLVKKHASPDLAAKYHSKVGRADSDE